MADQFVMCTRAVKRGVFVPEPGPTSFLLVPEGDKVTPTPKQAVRQDIWFKRLRDAAMAGQAPGSRGNLLIFIHGYNNNQEIVLQRHQQLKKDLVELGYQGEVLSFDWPSDEKTLNYLEDRHDAKKTAMQLVSDGISVLAERQARDCTINMHLIGHSTGAYVIREACDDADDTNLANNSWSVSQVIFIGGDISAASLSSGNKTTESLYRHCVRLTNYSSLYDSALKLSDAKRVGMASRVGRTGLPDDAPSKAVNVDCSEYFHALESTSALKQADQPVTIGSFDHSWHIGNKRFARDLLDTLKGDLDRSVIPTRETKNGKLIMKF